MANIQLAMEILKRLEFSNNNRKLLHKNPTENGLTFFGIYQDAHPSWEGWKTVEKYLEIQSDIEECSEVLSNVKDLMAKVYKFYKKEFWDDAKLDKVESQTIANEIFIFGVNVGMAIAIKKAQELIGVDVDGIVGDMTIAALNNYDADKFSIDFDDKEKEYYDKLIAKNNTFRIYKNGWYNRAEEV